MIGCAVEFHNHMWHYTQTRKTSLNTLQQLQKYRIIDLPCDVQFYSFLSLILFLRMATVIHCENGNQGSAKFYFQEWQRLFIVKTMSTLSRTHLIGTCPCFLSGSFALLSTFYRGWIGACSITLLRSITTCDATLRPGRPVWMPFINWEKKRKLNATYRP